MYLPLQENIFTTRMKKKNKTPTKQKVGPSNQTSIDSFFTPARTQLGGENNVTSSRKRTPTEQPSSSSAKKKNKQPILISLSSSSSPPPPPPPPVQSEPILIEDDSHGPSPRVKNQQAQASHSLSTLESITCPVCSQVLEDGNLALAERHINLCLDRPVLSTSSPSKPTPKLKRSESRGDEQQRKISTEEEETIDLEEKDDDEGSVNSLLSETKTIINSSKPRSAKTKSDGKKRIGAAVVGEKRRTGGGGRTVPFYKLMPGTTLSVDCFSHGAVPDVTGYFLSHAHSDHYTKLSSSWRHGKIYCSKTTANLVKLKLRVDPRWVVPLEFNKSYTIDDVRVVLIDANHCPGSAMFLFEGISKTHHKPFRYLHCGDFRATPGHLRHPEIHNKVIDICYLDTTYLDPKYCFPAQEQVIEGCCQAIGARVIEADRTATMSSKDIKHLQEISTSKALLKSWLDTSSITPTVKPLSHKEQAPALSVTETSAPNQPKLASIFERPTSMKEANNPKESEKRSLILVGTYSIGKERIVIELARRLSTKVFCADVRKRAIIGCIDGADEEAVLNELLTSNPFQAQIHLVNLFALNKPGFLEAHLAKFMPHFNHIIGIKPTGWAYKPRTSIPVNSLDFHTFISTFQQQEQQQQDDRSNAVGRLLFPEKVRAELAHMIEIYGVPYSEHSSFFELSCFCLSVDWVRIIPTVNCGSPASRAKMDAWIGRWKAERRRLLDAVPSSLPTLPARPASQHTQLPPPPPPGLSSQPLRPLLVHPRHPLYW